MNLQEKIAERDKLTREIEQEIIERRRDWNSAVYDMRREMMGYFTSRGVQCQVAERKNVVTVTTRFVKAEFADDTQDYAGYVKLSNTAGTVTMDIDALALTELAFTILLEAVDRTCSE